jgi:hypothetical protein
MQDQPDLKNLLASVCGFLQQEVVPTTKDPRLRFRTLVAANVLAIVGRELEAAEEQLREECRSLHAILGVSQTEAPIPEDPSALRAAVGDLTGQLAENIRDGHIAVSPGDPVWNHVRATVIGKLVIANPAYLKRVGAV